MEGNGPTEQLGDIPSPYDVSTAADFVAALDRLRKWSGLSYRALSARARAHGESLPHSTLASALGRTTLPSEELVKALVLACTDDEKAVSDWLAVRRRIALADDARPPAPGGDSAPRRSRRLLTAVLAGVPPLAILAIGAYVLIDRDPPTGTADPRSHDQQAGQKTGQETDKKAGQKPAARPALKPGWYRIASTWKKNRCVDASGQGADLKAIIIEWKCDETSNQHFYLESAASGTYRIRPATSRAGRNLCAEFTEGRTDATSSELYPRTCDAGSAHQRFRIARGSAPTYAVELEQARACLDIYPQIDKNDVAEILHGDCTERATQQFVIRPAFEDGAVVPPPPKPIKE